MDIKKANKILGLSPPISLSVVKRAYHKEALLHHPDRLPEKEKEEGTRRFQEIGEAYVLLSTHLGDKEHTYTKNDSSYEAMLRKFIYGTIGNKSELIDNILHKITTKCSTFSKKMLDNLDKKILLKMYDYINGNKDVLNISPDIIDFIHNYVMEKTKDDCVYNLNPTLSDILHKDVYLLYVGEKKYYIPLWHEEIQFDEEKCIIVRCVPDLPDHVTIDHHNNINVNLTVNISHLLEREKITFSLADQEYSIPGHKLLIKHHQTYVLRGVGIPKININDIYACDSKGDVIVHINL